MDLWVITDRMKNFQLLAEVSPSEVFIVNCDAHGVVIQVNEFDVVSSSASVPCVLEINSLAHSTVTVLRL